MKVFVTGHRGYIGAHLVKLLKDAGHQVTGCDIGLFDHCVWETLTPVDKELAKDIRDLDIHDLAGHDCVIHLAAISNDPMGDLDESITYSVNRDGSIGLAQTAKQAGVERFLFAGSCSVYGKKGSAPLDESADFAPVSAYARSKVDAERAILSLAGVDFVPVSLRNATAYGHSPMLRLDLVANNLLACALALGDIRIMSDGSPWRPLVHCKDIARALVAFLEAPADRVRGEAVNVGSNADNYQVKDIADRVKSLVPDANIVFTGEVGSDPRSYRVQFDHLQELLPGFKTEFCLDTGLEELYVAFQKHGFTKEDFQGDLFFRLRAIKKEFHRLQGDSVVA